jgi:hypothetical protein
MGEIKTLDLFKVKSFTANGQNYSVSSGISLNRYREYEKLEPKLTFGLSFDDIYKSLSKLYELLNKQKFADCAIISYNLMSGIKDIENEKREHPALLMAALVINRDNEDAGVYDEKLQLEKIQDWRKEGYDALPFFTFALSSIQGFGEEYRKYIDQEKIKNQPKKQVQNTF